MKTKIQLLISIIILFTVQLIAQVDSTKLSTSEKDSSEVKEYIIQNSEEQIFGKVEYNKANLFSTEMSHFLVDSTRYEIKDVKAFQNSESYFAKIYMEDDFVKRESEGKIDLYSTTYNYGGGSGGTFNTITTPHGSFTTFSPGFSGGTSTINYFSKDGGKVLNANYDNLREALKDNIESMALLDDYRTLNYVQYGAGIIGIGLIASAFIGVDKDTKPNFGTIALGGIIANIGIWIPSMVKSNKLQESIKVYNGLR